ncbi:MAG: tetratricopeptide repeat protein [Chthoniobacterales bacterium]|nr:tetratricopeptide repeat protein [Chthoniobacterales bacterium]
MSLASPRRKVLLIGWDAADWEHITPLLEEGLMPTLDGFINRGVIGNLATLQPILSPMLWNSVATGKFADKHGIHGFIEPDPINGGVRPYSSASRKCKALWNILSQSGLRSNVVGWWASHPAEPINGTVVTNAFGGVKFDPEKGWSIPRGTVHPAARGTDLARYRIFPNELTEAHILPFIPEAATIDQEKDKRLNSFAKVLSDNASIHAVATALMEKEPWDFTAIYYDGIDHFSHAFMAYHPPKLPWIKDEDFALYQGVVRGAYRFHDMMLERLLDLAGPETTVILCSDHGFESGSQRPQGTPREPAGPAIWHRQYGIFAMAGPGIRRDERIYGASLIDLAPTVLTLFDLPIGEDMDGRPLLEAFEAMPAVQTIPSWEDVPGDAGMLAADQQMDRAQAAELMQQFAALGYIEDPGADKEKAAESAEIEAKYNVARTYLWKGRADEALPLLEEIVRRRPWEDRFLSLLASAYFQAGYLAQAERLLLAIAGRGEPDNAPANLLWARIKLARGDLGGALQAVLAADAPNPRSPGVYVQIGEIYVRLRQWQDARTAYEKALALDEDNARAYLGLSNVYRRLGDNQQTVDCALRAVGLLHRLPLAHFNLGVALARFGENERAILAFETALRFQPEMVNAHRYLAALQKIDGGDPVKAGFHRGEVLRLTSRRARRGVSNDPKREQLFDLPKIPPRAERLATLLKERPDPKPEVEKSGKTFVLVSGLPRSGTSLMMQLLEAGGLPVMTDAQRVADIDNPRGYYEWEAIKQIAKKPELLDDPAVAGRAIKCISMLLPHLPPQHRYKVIFMTRPIAEVVTSQQAMAARLRTKGAELDRAQLERGLRAHREEIRQWAKGAAGVEWLEIEYPALVREPAAAIARLVDFLGAEKLPNESAMATAIDPALHRRRA